MRSGGAALERTLEVLELDQPTGAVERHPDRVEAQIVGARALGPLDQPAAGHPAHLRALARRDRLQRTARAGRRAPRLDLAEGERAPVEGDDVELAPPRPEVALDDRESAPAEVLRGELLAGCAELLTPVRRSPANATDDACEAWLHARARLCASRAGVGCAELDTLRRPNVWRDRA